LAVGLVSEREQKKQLVSFLNESKKKQLAKKNSWQKTVGKE
jgi:hypothetical protein